MNTQENEINIINDVSKKEIVFKCKNEFEIEEYCRELEEKNEYCGKFIYKRKRYDVYLTKIYHIYNMKGNLFGAYHTDWYELDIFDSPFDIINKQQKRFNELHI